MGKVVDFKKRNKAPTRKTSQQKQTAKAPNRESVLLWQFSENVDDAIRKAVLEQNLKPEEVAAILAHRLGTLINTTEGGETLLQFCLKVIERLNPKSEDSTNAS